MTEDALGSLGHGLGWLWIGAGGRRGREEGGLLSALFSSLLLSRYSIASNLACSTSLSRSLRASEGRREGRKQGERGRGVFLNSSISLILY